MGKIVVPMTIVLYAVHKDRTYLLQVDDGANFIHLDVQAQQQVLREMAYDAIINFYATVKTALSLNADDWIKCRLTNDGFDDLAFDLGRVSDLSKRDQIMEQ